MHLAGGLLRARWTTEETEAFIQAICIAAGDLEVQDRLRCVRDTAEKLERGEETTGWPSLYEFLDERVVKAGRKWLDLQTDDRRYNFSDLGNARRMSAAVGQDIRYCYSWRKWLVWDRKRWCIDTSGAIMRFARDTIRGIYEEARNEHDPDKRQQLGKWALASESERRMASMIKLLQSEPGISVSPDELDQNMFLLNCQNGTLDLRTGGLREFRREDMLTKITNAAYDPAAPHPMLDQHLAVCHSDNEGVIHFLHKAFGYSLTGAMTEDCFFLNYGQGRNGKSTMLEAVQHVMGEYAAMAAPETFMAKNRDGGIPNDLAALHGARFVIAIETGEGKRMAESVIKQITGGDRITARYLFSEYFTYQPSFKLWIGTNHPPTIRSNNVGIWSRVRMIPWNARLDLLPIYDNTFRERLPYEEATGILAWLVRGCLLWQSEGLGTPPEIEQATSDYRIDQDVLAGFISECCASEGLIKTSVLYKAYVGWCQRTGEVPIRNVTFKQRMLERGIRQVIRDGYPTWLDISLAVDINSLQTVFSAGGNGHDNPFGRPQD
jgi:putative DNA primase/helicase